MSVTKRYEGFWAGENHDTANFPMPKANSFNPKFKESFLEKLKKVEALSTPVMYMGHSRCRLCKNDKNGSVEYENGPWVWPSGYVHYIRDHNVAPSIDFYKFIKYYDISGISENILEYFIQKNQK